MIRLKRIPISDKALKAFGKRANKWKQFRTVSDLEAKSALCFMNGGHMQCMYCQDNDGREIDHFVPRSLDATKTNDWDNFIWSCGICNDQGHKGSTFPVEKGLNLLINPVKEDPLDYLDFSSTGLIAEVEGDDYASKKTNATIKALGLNQRNTLVETRACAWRTILPFLERYHNGDKSQKNSLMNPRIICVLAYFWKHKSKPELIGEEVSRLLQLHPEIGAWIEPELRSYEPFRNQWDKCIGQRLRNIDATQIESTQFTFTCKTLTLPKAISQTGQPRVGDLLKRYRVSEREVSFIFNGEKGTCYSFRLDHLD